MRLDPKDLKLLWDMHEAARAATSFVEGRTREEYVRDLALRFAVERAVEIVGEAARRVSNEARTELPGVAWGAIVATRHILAHEYGEVDHDAIWRIATQHLPELLRLLQPVLASHPPGPEASKDLAEP
jgi:uncharacterized protein with HEPN domain